MERLGREASPCAPEIDQAGLEKRLGQGVHRCELWRRSWRTRVYRVWPVQGAPVVVKQFRLATDEELTSEYAALGELSRLQIRGLKVPRPIALLPQQHAYALEPAPGRSLKSLFWDRADSDLVRACTLAGGVLARLHLRWMENISPVPVDALAADLAAMPGGLSDAEQTTIRRACSQLAPVQVPVGRVYLDFKASNIFCDNSALALIDPPERRQQSLLLWDVTTLLRDLRWQMWKAHLLRPWRLSYTRVEEALAAFERHYTRTLTRRHPVAEVPPLLLDLLQLQQTGQIMALQRGKLQLAARNPGLLGGNGWMTQETLVARASLPILRLQKRRLVRRLSDRLAESNRVQAPGGWEPARPRTGLAAFAQLVAAARASGGCLAQQGGVWGALGGAVLGILIALIAAVGRGWNPDPGTAVAITVVGVIAFAMTGGFLGMLVGGTGGALVGAVHGCLAGGESRASGGAAPRQV